MYGRGSFEHPLTMEALTMLDERKHFQLPVDDWVVVVQPGHTQDDIVPSERERD